MALAFRIGCWGGSLFIYPLDARDGNSNAMCVVISYSTSVAKIRLLISIMVLNVSIIRRQLFIITM